MRTRITIPLIAIVALVTACGGEGAMADTPVATTVNISPGNITLVVTDTITSGPAFSGTLVADRTASIRAEVAGSVIAVFLDPGSRVTKGTPLVRIDDSGIRDAVLSAKSGVTQADLANDIARREQERAEKLLAVGAVAQNVVEMARRSALGAQASLDDAKARLANAQKNLDNTIVKAPYDGVVSERMVSPGDIVAPGSPLVTVVDPSTMRLEGAVPADQLGAIRIGAPVSFTVTGYPGRAFTGTISNIYPTADPGTRQVRLYARIPNTGRGLVAGLFATGRIASTSHSGLVVPLTAIDERGLKPTVTRLTDGKAEIVEVTLGTRDDATEHIEITAGVVEGDTLLVGATAGITPGTLVRITSGDRAAAAPPTKP
ncbi:MAG: efflux RND transporter periplasmic adaptor subunit [Gemmatimonadetes bacterium]|nr:efflux RND transporter periplasmic adaptor subunit [Gemmatimonadota bacterium]